MYHLSIKSSRPISHFSCCDEKLYLEKIREYKTRQFEIAEEMKNHEKADQNFYVTANMVLNLAARAREIFESSEVEEKRQLLNLVFQNLQLRDASLSVQVQEPFITMIGYKDNPTNWRWRELNTDSWMPVFDDRVLLVLPTKII